MELLIGNWRTSSPLRDNLRTLTILQARGIKPHYFTQYFWSVAWVAVAWRVTVASDMPPYHHDLLWSQWFEFVFTASNKLGCFLTTDKRFTMAAVLTLNLSHGGASTRERWVKAVGKIISTYYIPLRIFPHRWPYKATQTSTLWIRSAHDIRNLFFQHKMRKKDT